MRFRDVVDEHQRGVYRLALQLTGHHQDAEDLMQDVFIKVHAKLDSFRGEASIKSWIYRITVNTYLNKRRKKALLFMKLRDDFDNTLTDARSNTERDAESNSIREHVHKALELLSPKERSAFALRHYNEYSVKEVAQALEVAEGTVKSLLFRAVKKLRKQLVFLVEE
ncbi:MAG: RNA polymerase sigma factor [Rhodothermaceae bacterium]|nr:RNA polymerase sigma factor [Rhodothermaceae bacterium]